MAQLERIEVNHKIGYKNRSGHIVIEPIYDEGPLFVGSILSEDTPLYVSVMKEGECGVIDQYGNTIIPFEYEEAYHLTGNLFAVRKKTEDNDWLFGVINTDGTTIIPFKYKFITHNHNFIQCFVSAKSKRKYSHRYMDTSGYIYDYNLKNDESWYNASGEQIYKGEGFASSFNYLIVKEDDKLGVIDATGKYVIQCLYTEIHCIAKDRFVVRRDNETSWQFGVIDNRQNVIIDFNYKFISHDSPSFYECFKEAQCELMHSSSENEYSHFSESIWFNEKGIKVFEGKAEILSDNFLAISSNDKWGVITQSNKRIVNFLYDNVRVIKDKIIVVKDSKLGVLGEDGSIFINPSYRKIECATTNNNTYIVDGRRLLYGKYSNKCKFDTEDIKPKLLCAEVSCANNTHGISITNESDFDFEKLFILYGDNYCELFSIYHDGIIANSRYEIIRKLTDNYFAVKQKDKWGVFRGNHGEILIPCEYDRIIFEGGRVVFVNNGDLWGAKTIMPQVVRLWQIINVDVPVKYKEIKTLNSGETLFGVKVERRKYDDSVVEEYTILDEDGDIYQRMDKFSDLDKQCEIFDSNFNRILASKNNKYGFISSKGYVAIPFQFDSVEKRDDGYFDVQIDGAWGILDISGREIVRIKYSNRLPLNYADTIVQNALTGRYGILSEDGTEKIPSIYEHLMVEDNFIFFGYDGYNDGGNFFSEVDYATWGVMDDKGKTIIQPDYDCYKIQDGFLLAGRNGRMLNHNESDYGSDYSGVYDLYTLDGELLFGGFSEFFYNEYDEGNKLFVFFLGGAWECYSDVVDEWNSIYKHDYIFKRGIGLWLFLDKDFKSIMRNPNGKQLEFKKGTICNIEVKQQENKKTYVYNMPISVMAKGFFGINGYNIIIGDSNDEDERNYAALNITTGEQTPYYQKIRFIDESTFFFSEDNKIGIRNYKEIIVNAEFLFISYPVNGFYFVAKELDDNSSSLILCSLIDSNLHEVAIEKMDTSELIDHAVYDRLNIKCENEGTDMEKIILPGCDIFDESFIHKVSQKEFGYFCSMFEDICWFSNDYRMGKKEHSRNYGNREDYDYARDTWDAMTDGQYGDMPDGFDGDYSFLGY